MNLNNLLKFELDYQFLRDLLTATSTLLKQLEAGLASM
jgi:hypothetical protein